MLGLGGFAAFVSTQSAHVEAADHLDPPARTNPADPPGGAGAAADRAADIADVYAWHRGTGADASLVIAMSFSGPNAPVAGQTVSCDRDVLYTIHVDNTDDGESEFDIEARFGHDGDGNCLVQFTDIPGTTAPVVAATERNLTRGDVSVFAGLRDDAFFFDLQGFRETVAMGSLRFDSTRDFFAGQNTSIMVIEMPLGAVLGTPVEPIRVWGTTQRHAP